MFETSKRQPPFTVPAVVDISGKVRKVDRSAPLVRVKTIWMAGVRFSFDGRFYYARKNTRDGIEG